MYLTKMISIETKLKIFQYADRIKGLFRYYSHYKNIRKKKVYIIGVPEYSNLGDHAIAIAQRVLLEEIFPHREIIEITNDMINAHCLAIKYTLKKDDVITLIGGGNFGDEYLSEQNTRMLSLKYFRRNKIVMFPQTVYFTDAGQNELRKTQMAIEKCKNLHMIYREKKSYDFAMKNFPSVKNYLAIDTVLCLKYKKIQKRKGILICCRSDKEAFIAPELVYKIEMYFQKKGKRTKKIDTVLEQNVNPNERESTVYQYLDLFSKSEMVITDRLHGMIFSAITGTPCVVFPNYNHKVCGCYDTIKELDYIRLVEEPFYPNFELLMSDFLNYTSMEDYEKKVDKYKSLIRDIVAS